MQRIRAKLLPCPATAHATSHPIRPDRTGPCRVHGARPRHRLSSQRIVHAPGALEGVPNSEFALGPIKLIAGET
jgi:hypothetical protein